MLTSLEQYEDFIYNLPTLYPSIIHSTLVFVRYGLTIAEVRGQV